jgi:ATP-dependent DNA helicase RecG
MTDREIRDLLNIRNDETIILSAKEGLSRKFWESYSALANTGGGIIVLGARLLKHNVYELESEINLEEMKSRFLQDLNTIGNISCTELTTTEEVVVKSMDEKNLLCISVNRASREHRPVFTGHNPMVGSYRSNFNSIYKLSWDEVIGFYIDRSIKSFDSNIKLNFGLFDLDYESLHEYRTLFVKHNPNHEWSDLSLHPVDFWTRLNVLCRDRKTGYFGISIAGLLMFGTAQTLSDPELNINIQLEYRRYYSSVPQGEYEDRLQMDGSWTPNLFQFYQKVHGRITEGLIIESEPTKDTFQIMPSFTGNEEREVFEALKDAFVKVLIHADYRGQGGVLVERFFDRLEITFPGILSNNPENLRFSSASHYRNPLVQHMFNMIGIGDRGGSGFALITTAWSQQSWKPFKIHEHHNPSRVSLAFPIASNSSKAIFAQRMFQTDEALLHCRALQKYAIIIADIEGSVTNTRLQQMYDLPGYYISQALTQLVEFGKVYKEGILRGAVYRIPKLRSEKKLSIKLKDEQDSKSIKKKMLKEFIKRGLDEGLYDISSPVKQKDRMVKSEMHKIILEMCAIQELTANDFHFLFGNNAKGIRDNYLKPAVEAGELLLKYPENKTHPKQAYRTKPDPLKSLIY